MTTNVEYDAAALRIVDRIRSSLALGDVLQYAVDELGRATAVSRSLIQLVPGTAGVAPIVEWDRGDTRPLDLLPPTPIARRVLESGEAFVLERLEEADDTVREYLTSVGSVSAVAIPVRWQRDIRAVVGFEDSEERTWDELAVPLLERLEPHLGAAIAQAELYEQQQAALRQMKELDRMRDELLANVSHELRTPLTSIVGSIKTLGRQDIQLDDERRRQMLEIMEDQADRLVALTEDILQLSRYTRGQRVLQRSHVRLGELVGTATRAVDPGEGREIALDVEQDGEVEADRNRMVQVFTNLLENAVRHGAGRITVRCFVEDGNAVAWVGDEGDGVAPSYADEMFTAFSHAGGRSDSTGLGLSIARAIVDAHGGTLAYLPRADGRTHQFAVTLPAVA